MPSLRNFQLRRAHQQRKCLPEPIGAGEKAYAGYWEEHWRCKKRVSGRRKGSPVTIPYPGPPTYCASFHSLYIACNKLWLCPS